MGNLAEAFIYVIDLNKSQGRVKAHFRRDPRTGKMVFIKDFNRDVHGDPDHTIMSGHQMKVNNPRSKYHGQTVKVSQYSEKYDCVRCKADGDKMIDLQAHHLEHTGMPAAAPAPVKQDIKRTPVIVRIPAKQKVMVVGDDSASASEYNFKQQLSSFLKANDSFKSTRWDKVLADKGWVRYYLKDGYKDAGWIQVMDSTGEPMSVGARDYPNDKVIKLFKDLKKTWRAKTGEKLDLERAFADAGIVLKSYPDGSHTLEGNTFDHKDVIANAGGKWDRTFKRYGLPMTADLYGLVEKIPPHYTKEEIDGKKDYGQDGNRNSLGARPADTQLGTGQSDDVPLHGGASDGGRDTGSDPEGGRDAAEVDRQGGRRKKIRGLESLTIKELTELIHKTGIKSPEPTVKIDPKIASDLTLYDHQIAGVETICSTFNSGADGFLLGDDTGTGKTYTAAAVMAQMKVKQGLVVCPNDGVRKQWKEVLEKSGLKITMADGTKTNFARTDGVLLATYATFRQNKSLHLHSRDMVVFDEAHSMKNLADGATQQAQAGYTLVREQMRNKKKVLYCSATAYERPWQAKIYEALGLWEPGRFDSWVEKRGVKIGWRDVPTKYGVKQIKEYSLVGNGSKAVKATLVDHIQMVRAGSYLAREVHPEGVELHNLFNMTKMDDDQKKTYDSIRGFYDKAMENASGRMKGQIKAQRLMWSRRFMESVKLPSAIKIARQEVSDGKKVAIMVGYKSKSDVTEQIAKMRGIVKSIYGITTSEFQKFEREMEKLGGKIEGTMQSLRKAFPDAVEYHGDIPTGLREMGKQDFNTGDAKVLIATQQSADTGLSLHDTVGDASRCQINVTLPWSGTSMKQLAGRTHRLGSKSDTNMVWLFADSPDEKDRAEMVSTKMRLLGASTKGLDVEESDELYKRLAEFMMGVDPDGDSGLSKSFSDLLLITLLH